jgi:hypothetical protein
MSTSPIQRPNEVIVGSALFASSLIAALLHVVLNASGAGPTPPPDASWSVLFVAFLALDGVLVWFAFQGRNWARIVCAGSAVLTVFAYGESCQLLRSQDFHPLGLFGFVTGLLPPFAAVALFLPAANSWYARIKSARAAV